MKVALHSVYRERDAQAPSRIDFLRTCAEHAALKRHELVELDDDADAVLITEAWRHCDSILYGKIRRSPIINEYRGRLFVYCDSDAGCGPLPGFYPSITPLMANAATRVSSPYVTPLMQRFECVPERTPSRLYGFRGSVRSHPCRRALREVFNSRGLYEDVTDAWARAGNGERQRLESQYVASILDAKFVLCPRGCGASSYRIFEAMALGRVPVIISDAWVEPSGPDWNECSIRVPEGAIAHIPRLLAELEPRWVQLAANAAREYRSHFATWSLFNWLADQMHHILTRRAAGRESRRSSFAMWVASAKEEAGFMARSWVRLLRP